VYLVAVKNLGPFLEALRHAQAPEKVGLKFVEDIGFKSTNDRLFIPLLRAMKFVDDAGKPTARYHSFLDDNEWKTVLADGIRDAFPDLFRVNKTAHTLSREQLTGKLKSLGEGKLSPAILSNTTKTFIELVKLADFSSATSPAVPTAPAEGEGAGLPDSQEKQRPAAPDVSTQSAALPGPTLVYRIEIVLPAVRDQAVYDAIFKSAREHLLR
jgi:hypothetical protein